MRRSIVLAVTVLGIQAAAALAVPGFSMPPLVGLLPGQSVDVNINAYGVGSLESMLLTLYVDSPFVLSNPRTVLDPPIIVDPPQEFDNFVSVYRIASFPLFAPQTVATITLTAPAGIALGTTGTVTTDPPAPFGDYGPSDLNVDLVGNGANQASTLVRVIPEPASIMLLAMGVLAGLKRRTRPVAH